MSADFVYLASSSPRRRELLRQIGVACRVLEVAVDERPHAGEAPERYVARLASAKAEAGWHARPAALPADNLVPPADNLVPRADVAVPPADIPVLAADTAVVVDGEILGKPRDRDDGEAMLRKLSGRSHRVLTAVCLTCGALSESRLSVSSVTFRIIGAAEARAYWDSGEPRDKAGGYAVQGLAAVFISELNGSYSGVMGLPLFETAELLRGVAVPCWRTLAAGIPGA